MRLLVTQSETESTMTVCGELIAVIEGCHAKTGNAKAAKVEEKLQLKDLKKQ